LILESCYWKDPLLESAIRLCEFSESTTLEESQMVQTEKDIFIGFYAIRKLMDTVKIKDSTRDLNATCGVRFAETYHLSLNILFNPLSYLVRFGRGAAVSKNDTKCSVDSSEIHTTTTENIGRLSHVK
jgi:hypothetical protein